MPEFMREHALQVILALKGCTSHSPSKGSVHRNRLGPALAVAGRGGIEIYKGKRRAAYIGRRNGYARDGGKVEQA